jgi:DsbC/DsbD-like thiol-disulfide interchange protein
MIKLKIFNRHWIRYSLVLIAIIFFNNRTLDAQILRPVHWSYAAKRIAQDQAVILIKAEIEDGWHIYSTHQKDGGPVKTSIVLLPAPNYILVGKLSEPKPIIKYDKTFEMKVNYFEKSVIFQQRIKLKQSQMNIRGKLEYMACNDHQCLPPENVGFTIPIK